MSLLLGGDRDQLKENPASLLLGGGAFLFVYCPCVDVSASKEIDMATYTYEDIRDLEGDQVIGGTFEFGRQPATLREITFINCTFEGGLGTIVFEDCSVKKCRRLPLRSWWYYMVVSLDLFDSDLIECEFPINTSLEGGSFESLSGSSGIPVKKTDPYGNRRRDLSDNLLSVEELVAKKAESKIKKLEVQVDRAQGDKELETLAKEVGKLQAQPEFKDYHKHQLLDLRDRIEGKYSVVGKGLRYLRRLFKKGHRASQIRVASQMNRELQREIRELKRDLRK